MLMQLKFGDGKMYNEINSTVTSGGVVNADSRGFYITKRDAANSVSHYRNAVNILNEAIVSAALTNFELYILAVNDNGVPDICSPIMVANFLVGANLDEIGNSEVTNFTNTLETYMDYVGAGVISECLWLILLLIPNVRRKEEELRIVA